MRIDFVFVDTGFGKKTPVNPEAVEYIYADDSSTGCGAAILVLRSGGHLLTSISVEAATRLFSPLSIAGGR